MAIRTLDELNNVSTKPEDYFGDMDLTDSQIEERLRFTDESYEAILDSMYEIDTYKEFGTIDYDAIRQRLDDRMAAIIAGYVVLDDYLRQYSSDFAQNFVDATERHIDDEWYLSEDRALFGAENSANDALNYKDYQKAVDDGYTHKKWVTEHDNKVRDSHRKLDGKIIPIMDYFEVGDALMRFPKDYELAFDSPRETINCRCGIKYLNKGKSQDNVVEISAESVTMESSIRGFLKDNRGGIFVNNEDVPNYQTEKAVIPQKKIVGYCLNPEKEHYGEFIEAGYSELNPKELADDILRNFDYSKRIDVEMDGDAIQYAQIMTLGVGKERTFRTIWRIDKEFDGKPRFISAYRNNL